MDSQDFKSHKISKVNATQKDDVSGWDEKTDFCFNNFRATEQSRNVVLTLSWQWLMNWRLHNNIGLINPNCCLKSHLWRLVDFWGILLFHLQTMKKTELSKEIAILLMFFHTPLWDCHRFPLHRETVYNRFQSEFRPLELSGHGESREQRKRGTSKENSLGWRSDERGRLPTIRSEFKWRACWFSAHLHEYYLIKQNAILYCRCKEMNKTRMGYLGTRRNAWCQVEINWTTQPTYKCRGDMRSIPLRDLGFRGIVRWLPNQSLSVPRDLVLLRRGCYQ